MRNKLGKMLLVDDNKDNLLVLEDMLFDDYELSFAKNGEEAIAALLADDFDLAVFDIMMPVLDGISAVQKLRKEHDDNTPVIFLTAFGDVANVHEAVRLSARGFFLKPIDENKDELLRTIYQIVSSSGKERLVSRILSDNVKRIDLTINSDSNSIEGVINYLASLSIEKKVKGFDEDKFKTVLQEVLLNIQYYGCFGIDSRMREEDIFDRILRLSHASDIVNQNRINISFFWNEVKNSIMIICEDPTDNFHDWKNIIKYDEIEPIDDLSEDELFYRITGIRPLFDDIFAVHGRGYHMIDMYCKLYISESGRRTTVEFAEDTV